MDLVLRGGLDVLDGAGLDDREQALGVPAGAGRERWAGCGRGDGAGRRGAVATAVPPPPASVSSPPSAFALADLERSRRWAGMRLASPEAAAGSAAPPSAGASAVAPDSAALAASAFLRASSARLRRCSGISAMVQLPHKGPEMPPSLRTRQKWIAMKITMVNGSISTCRTYHRRSVSELISAPPRSTNRTSLPNTGV